MAAKKVSVFIGSSSEGKTIADKIDSWLTDKAGDELEVTVWTDGPFALSESYLESLTKAARRYDFAILVATADDAKTIHSERVLEARDNVIFELGLFMGRLGRFRTFLVSTDEPNLRLPSDLSGISAVRFSQSEMDGDTASAIKRIGQQLLRAIQSATDQDGGMFVLFPSLRNDPFYLDLLAGIASPSSGTRDIALLIPNEAYNGHQFLEKLDELIGRQRGFKGGVIAPTLAGIDVQEVRKRIDRFRIPIVVVDVNPYDDATMPEKVHFIGVDNHEGGRLAGAYMRDALGTVGKARVLVLGNRDHAKRQEGFLDGLGDAHETHVCLCDFSAEAGRRATARALRHHTSPDRPFNGIFAVSDEIAVGAVEALSEVTGGAGAKTVVVGFDGTPGARAMIDLRVTALRNTVVQDAYELGKHAIGMLREIVDGSSPSKQKRQLILPVQMYV